ncbi:MAG: redoxin domain-containing protein [Candidatus Omnitrophota bacterium]
MAEFLVEERALIPSFHLSGRQGVFDSSVYKRKKNLVLFFLTEPDAMFLMGLDEASAAFRQENAEIAVITPLSMAAIQEFHKKNRLGFPLLCDEGGEVTAKFLALAAGEKAAALFITDRYGEIYFRYLAAQNSDLPPFEDITKSLNFIESQCPECGGLG